MWADVLHNEADQDIPLISPYRPASGLSMKVAISNYINPKIDMIIFKKWCWVSGKISF